MPAAERSGRLALRAAGTLVTVAVVALGAALFAHGFRHGALAVAEAIASDRGADAVGDVPDGPSATDLSSGHGYPGADAVITLGRAGAAALVFGGVVAAAVLGRAVERRHGPRVGLRALAASARGDAANDPSLTGTLMRSGATFTASASLASLGREAPIMEMGGAWGDTVGRLTGRPRHRLAVAGIASAFAVAYHAPAAALLYVEEHLGMRHDRRTVSAAVVGALAGFASAAWLFGAHPIFPSGDDPLTIDVVVLCAVALVPAYLASRLFRWGRARLAAWSAPGGRLRWWPTLGLAAVAALTVAFVPLTSGNGMEAIVEVHEAARVTVGLALALCVWKLVATSATIGTGAPGGVVSPSLAVAAGAGLLTWWALDGLGAGLPEARWDAVLVTASVGVAISVRAPLVAAVMVAEMSADLRLLPLTAAAVGLASLADHHLAHERLFGPAALDDEDA
ncbi:MAG: chloride channel protein [Acidimicrobiales bacterium]|nr:chloride channel protein [Acidimicrobiales bacterium]MCB9395725.1 chloride channel protein [Acidimicrobiaceae bacterium]